MADPVTNEPEELRSPELAGEGALALLRRSDFRRLPTLAVAVAVLALAVTISTGTWIGGVPELVRTVPDVFLGRVSGLISLVHRGAHATGLLFVAPLFAIGAPRSVFAAAASLCR